MDKLFGLPIETVFIAVICMLVSGLIMTAAAALRNRVLFKIGIRNIARRPAQTVLIVLGLMLATLLVSAALVTGDTIKHSIQKTALEDLGAVDIVVKAKDGINGPAASSAAISGMMPARLHPADYDQVERALQSKPVDGLTIAVMQNVPATNRDRRRNLPGLELLGVKPDYAAQFGAVRDSGDKNLAIGSLALDEAYLSAEASEKLDAAAGDTIELFILSKSIKTKVAGVFAEGGKPSSGVAIIVPLKRAQAIFALGESFDAVLISGRGDSIDGAARTKVLKTALTPIFTGTPFGVSAVKKKALDNAEEQASMISSLFLVFGQFSMVAGIMLISLIFVMLAAERKIELGVMRALGTRKSNIVKIFLFEGAVYATLSAAVGALLGIAVGWVMVHIIGAVFSEANFTPSFAFLPRSILLAYGIGLVATFIVVLFAARRAGKINIVRAIRDLPEPVKTGRSYKSLIFLGLGLAGGVFLAMNGLQERQQGPLLLGLSLIIIAVPLLGRWIRLPDRAAFSVAGIGLLTLWLLPNGVLGSLIPQYDKFSAGLEMFFLSGVAIVTGAVWTVMYNSDILMKLVTTVFGRLKGFPPMLRIAVNFPLKSRVRTGLTLAMFSLVVFTIVFMSILLNSMSSTYDDTRKLAGGYDIQGSVGPANPIASIKKALADSQEDLRFNDFTGIGSLSIAPAATRQQKTGKNDWNDNVVLGVDRGYGESVDYKFHLKSKEYRTDRDVWAALNREKDVAIVHSALIPARVSFAAGRPEPPFQFSGVYREDEKLPRLYLETKNAATGKIEKLRVIGVLNDSAYTLYGTIITGQATLEKIAGGPVAPTNYWFKTKAGQSAARAAEQLSKVFYQNGMETVLVQEDIAKDMRSSLMFNKLLEGFMGLGLLVGIAGLSVIAARTIVERRRFIGMLRAIGFRSSLVQRTFFLESSFIAWLGITLGSVLALVLCRNVIASMATDVPGLTYQVPWGEIGLIAGIAYVASLAATYLPSRQASRVLPAEALRYE